MASNRPFVIDVAMQNAPVETAGHWNIMDIYSPGKKVHHADTSGSATLVRLRRYAWNTNLARPPTLRYRLPR